MRNTTAILLIGVYGATVRAVAQCPAYPQDFTESTHLLQVWSQTNKDGASLTIPGSGALGLSRDTTSEHTNTYDRTLIIRTLLEPRGQLALACGIAACNLKRVPVSEPVLDDFLYLCFGGDPQRRSDVHLNNSMVSINVSPTDFHKTLPVSFDLTGNASAAMRAKISDPTGRVRAKRQSYDVPQGAKNAPVDLAVNVPDLPLGKVDVFPFRVSFENSNLVFGGGIEVKRADDDGSCRVWKGSAGHETCSKCVLPVAFTDGNIGDLKQVFCRKMPLGAVVDIEFDAMVTVKNTVDNQYQARISIDTNNVPSAEPKPSALMIDPAHPNPTQLSSSIVTYVPTQKGPWGSAGTIAAKVAIDHCITKMRPTTCDVKGDVRVTVR